MSDVERNGAPQGAAEATVECRLRELEAQASMLARDNERPGRIMVCEPVMNRMTLTRDELIDGVEFGGVTSFLDEALKRSFTLFI